MVPRNASEKLKASVGEWHEMSLERLGHTIERLEPIYTGLLGLSKGSRDLLEVKKGREPGVRRQSHHLIAITQETPSQNWVTQPPVNS